MKINIIGGVLGETGYDSHVRGLVLGLEEAGAEVTVETNLADLWDRNPHLSDRLITVLRRPWEKRAPCIMVSQPPFWHFKLSDRPEKFYGFLVWEGDRLPESWVKDCNHEGITGIFVPSEHTKKAALASGVKTPIHVIPHGVDLSLFSPREVSQGFAHLIDKERCGFVFNKGWAWGVNDRSGFDILARAFNQEFSKDEPVRLIVHINKAYCPPNWNFGVEFNQLGLQAERGQVVYVDNQLPFKEVASLYNLGDFIVSSSKAEAFNLTVLEGMASGLVPIVSDTGGEIDYVNDENGYVYPSEGFIPAWGDISYEGVQWRLPKIENLRKALRQAFVDWQQIKSNAVGDMPRLLAKKIKCKETVERYTWKKTGEKILEVIK